MNKLTKFFVTLSFIVLCIQGVLMSAKAHKLQSPDVNWIGKAHNVGVEYVFTHLSADDLVNPDQLEQVVAKLAEEYIKLSGVPDVVPAEITKEGRVLLDRLFTLIDEEPPLAEFQRQLAELEAETYESVNAEEATAIAGAISVARYSGELWTPITEGGLSGWRYLPGQEGNDEQAEEKIDWGDVVKADVKGFLSSFFSIKKAIIASVIELIMQILF